MGAGVVLYVESLLWHYSAGASEAMAASMILPNGMVFLTRDEFERLPNYSSTLPTGTTAGKQWKRAAVYSKQDVDKGHQWWRGSYGEPYPESHEFAGQVPITWQKLVVEGTPLLVRLWARKGS